MQKKYLTVGEVAEMLAYSERHVRVLLLEGTIPGGIRIGKGIRVDAAELEAYLSESRIERVTA